MKPLVGIIMGSTSDWDTLQSAADTLQRLGVAFETRVVSAHRTPDLLFWMAYEGTPYQHPPEGYVESVRSITLEDVRTFYRDHYVRGNVSVGIGGGYPAGFPGRVRTDIDALPEGTVKAAAAPKPCSDRISNSAV